MIFLAFNNRIYEINPFPKYPLFFCLNLTSQPPIFSSWSSHLHFSSRLRAANRSFSSSHNLYRWSSSFLHRSSKSISFSITVQNRFLSGNLLSQIDFFKLSQIDFFKLKIFLKIDFFKEKIFLKIDFFLKSITEISIYASDSIFVSIYASDLMYARFLSTVDLLFGCLLLPSLFFLQKLCIYAWFFVVYKVAVLHIK